MYQAMGAPSVMKTAIKTQETEIYPENLLPFRAFTSLQTQWHSGGMGGRSGMIYSEVYKWMDEQGITKRKKRQDTMWAVQVMEGEALKVWAEKRE